MKKYLVILVSFVAFRAQAQTIQVPNNVYFADIHMNIEESARVKIQKNVDYLLKYPAYYQQKVERADTYFPIIERVFKEAGVPDDFKYLALQESGLVSDAVSKSNAVGFWQFKAEAASDFGLKVNQQVDERRHIIEASRSAAKYFKQSNSYYKNWANSLVSYYMGFTGAKAYASSADAGSRDMTISDKTHIYLLTFLAHKIAFENAVGKNAAPAVTLKEMRANPGQSLGDIALAMQTDPLELEKYNKWLLNSTVPADKDYTVIIPVTNANATAIAMNTTQPAPVIIADEPKKTVVFSGKNAETGTLNGLNVIYAQAGDTKDKLALQAKISSKKFLKFNDLHGFEEIVPGQAYYTEKKNKTAATQNHIALPNETLWSIAQKYGVQLKTILSKNRMKKNESLVTGRVLWLKETRPAKIAVEYQDVQVPASPKTPAPLAPSVALNRPAKEVIMETSVTTTESDRKPEKIEPVKKGNSITETASATIRRAGKALQVKPEPDKVAEVSTESMDLSDSKPVENVAVTENIPVVQISESAITQPEFVAEVKTEKALATTSEKAEIKTETPVAIREEIKPEITASVPASETPKTLYPKNETTGIKNETTEVVAKAEPEYQNVVLREPITKTVANSAKNPATDIYIATTHKVAKGETLYAIARKYSVSANDLKTWNKLGEKPLAIGQELTLRAPEEVKKATTQTTKAVPVAILVMEEPVKTQPISTNETAAAVITHKVGSGESMYQISRKYGVSIKEIMEWNNKADFNVSAGDELIVKSKPGSSRN